MAGLQGGFTTGACAAAAAKMAAALLCGEAISERISIPLLDGTRESLPLAYAHRLPDGAEAAVYKNAGDDPDVTNGALIIARVVASDKPLEFRAGEGVGIITKPGLALPPGEPAINPGPRLMIESAVREVTDRGLRVTIAIPDGKQLAERTFNPRLGIKGGISVLGTTGRVRPFSLEAVRKTMECSYNVACASGVRHPVLVPGHIGERAAHRHFQVTQEQVVEAGNEWGFMIDLVAQTPPSALLVLGHPGKLAKLPLGHWDTHSSRSASPVPSVRELATRILECPVAESTTVEGVFADLTAEQRQCLGDTLARALQIAVSHRLDHRAPVATALINLAGDMLGSCGDLTPWQ
ncbi:cobalt-precorrin-5B C1-methyltransferase [Syntrophotalea carbinolica DSM 2380]|uniref:Cobalt-precorrin-5B C(1)-methyltransferase n=1 Tax=Syntrophotalea carbinolica (strain DSM 2380 / NBRC 103641 / GraBd1) TaxID=338963 RepID=CBID_SYNC1|nr:cobalt-precorrin-5B (C(1))-methyltransferase CbiD [Syntrophotalea carbinolica]Q3A7A9.1 RecName: Full=Cobalt-precorrin-5B C(1)-methyltransferase; AltName: Full=Cobalt-precorrin-6A synthase [Syntrophotalea carbinolica DSM 2380]ABA87735.1 cobalt-precorrin-5B C1-methyltransferase [Syntrophotalea carbinolica DSM 2380]